MTLDLNHDGVKDYIKRNNLELKNVERKDTHFHYLLRSRDPRTVCSERTGAADCFKTDESVRGSLFRIIRNQSDKFNAETVILSILFLLFSNKLI